MGGGTAPKCPQGKGKEGARDWEHAGQWLSLSLGARCWGGGLRGGLEPWRWLPDVTGLSGNRLRAELPKAVAAAAAARGLVSGPSTRCFCSRHCSRGRGVLPCTPRAAPGKKREVTGVLGASAWGGSD